MLYLIFLKNSIYLNTNIEEVASCNPTFVNWIAIYHPPLKWLTQLHPTQNEVYDRYQHMLPWAPWFI